MDTLAYILKTLRKFILILVLAWVIIFTVGIFFPGLAITTIFSSGSSTAGKDWLPAPGSFQGLLGARKVSSGYDNVYVPGEPYNGYGNAYNSNYGGADVDYVTFTASGTQIIRGGKVSPSNQQPVAPGTYSSERSLYIRNLSIFEGGHIYTGISFTGEAKSTMFKDGRFPVILLDQTGKMVSVAPAEAVSNWSTPGWARFQIKINAILPNKTPCTMIFQSGNGTPSQKPVYVSMPILCN